MNLVAVQAKMQLEHYQTAETFKQRIMALSERAVDGLPDEPTLLAFPELIGMPLLLSLAGFSQGSSLRGVFFRVLRQSWREVLRAVWHYRAFGLNALYLPFAIPAYCAYKEAFAEAARVFNVTIVAGSSFLPHIEEEAARGVHIADAHVHNIAFSFAPTGTLLGRTRKVYLTAGAESAAGLSRGQLNELLPIETPLGRVGVTLCLDGFYSAIIEQYDSLGTEILVQPSANHADWYRPWPPHPDLTEGEAWLRYGLRQQLQNRQALHYGVNPMMVGDLWDLQARGRSSIVVNTSFKPAILEGYEGLLAIAESDTEESFVRLAGC